MIPLKDWAAARGINVQTAGRYITEGRISPPAELGTRGWLVRPDAERVALPTDLPHRSTTMPGRTT